MSLSSTTHLPFSETKKTHLLETLRIKHGQKPAAHAFSKNMGTFSWPEHVGHLLYNTSFSPEHRAILRLFAQWETCVGAELAKRISPFSFGHGVLCIKAVSPAWQQELTYLKQQIIQRIHASLGVVVVSDIKIFSGHTPPKPSAPAPAAPDETHAVPNHEETLSAEATSMLIEDPEVRKAFAHTMAHMLAAQRIKKTT
jgi:hypothetical protein